MRWRLRLISCPVANQYNFLRGVTGPAAFVEGIPAHQRLTPSQIECQPGQERKQVKKGLLHCLILPKSSTVTYAGCCLLLNCGHLRPAATVVARWAAEVDRALALCIQVGGDARRTFPQPEAHRPHPQRFAQEQ